MSRNTEKRGKQMLIGSVVLLFVVLSAMYLYVRHLETMSHSQQIERIRKWDVYSSFVADKKLNSDVITAIILSRSADNKRPEKVVLVVNGEERETSFFVVNNFENKGFYISASTVTGGKQFLQQSKPTEFNVSVKLDGEFISL